ncbi:MAG: nucleoside phosphorylase [Desulfobaccales bacterium]|nr:nucleoside phosphorylase [Desulfobaccales bacterium]
MKMTAARPEALVARLKGGGRRPRPLAPSPATLPKNAQGRFYHLNCGPGDLAPYILTCGHPERAKKIARLLDRVQIKRRHREFLTFTGAYRNIPVSVMATGIGTGATAIAVIEACQCVSPVTFIRLGSTGALQDYIALGDLVITTEALRDENTTHYYAPADLKALAHPQVLTALIKAAATLGFPHHVGLTCTTADFYAGQGRVVPGFPTLDPGKVARLSRAGVLNFEMEMSAYLTLAAVSTYNLRAGGICAVFNNRLHDNLASPKLMRLAEERLIQTGLLTLEILAAEDGM